MSVSVAGLVLLTIAYTDQFNFPLKTSEIYQRLIAISIDKKKLLEILKLLADKKLITQKADCTQKAGCTHKAGCTCEVGCWQLRTRLIKPELRWAREKLSQTRWPEVDELSRIIGWIGWVKGIGVTGSLAMKNIRPKSDIDFMIVT
ncbi:nucleotidyltransferase domain-containing protein, partial [Patescibacteria group bacterium]|nr:nucleotidyltransferase domain-containing protein [Patescibacteria group bacterium]